MRSIKGNKGGFALAVPPEKIYLSDLITVFQGAITFIDCFSRKKECPEISNCRVRDKIKNIERLVLSALEAITIASLQKDASL